MPKSRRTESLAKHLKNNRRGPSSIGAPRGASKVAGPPASESPAAASKSASVAPKAASTAPKASNEPTPETARPTPKSAAPRPQPEPARRPEIAAAELDAIAAGVPTRTSWLRPGLAAAGLVIAVACVVGLARPAKSAARVTPPPAAAALPASAPKEPTSTPKSAPPAQAASGRADERPAPIDPPKTEPAATAVPAEPPTALSAETLREQALALLRASKNPEAIAAARVARDADPLDALPYLVLGSALQDEGRWDEATRTYSLCAQTAKRGMVDECRAMLRRKW